MILKLEEASPKIYQSEAAPWSSSFTEWWKDDKNSRFSLKMIYMRYISLAKLCMSCLFFVWCIFSYWSQEVSVEFFYVANFSVKQTDKRPKEQCDIQGTHTQSHTHTHSQPSSPPDRWSRFVCPLLVRSLTAPSAPHLRISVVVEAPGWLIFWATQRAQSCFIFFESKHRCWTLREPLIHK